MSDILILQAPPGTLATETKQDDLITAIENITIPAPTGGATEVNQETLNSLVETLQELVQRLAPLASAMNAGAPALRTTPIASVSTAVTGTVAVSAVTNLTNFGTGTPAKEVADDINNQMVTLCNINNVTAS